MKKIYPKCLEKDAEYGNTARGFILPCCWLDTPDLFDGDAAFLVKEKFKLDNVDSVDEILESDEWTQFYSDLRNDIGPKQCHSTCGSCVPISEI